MYRRLFSSSKEDACFCSNSEYPTTWRSGARKVVRDGIGKRFQFLVARFELAGPLGEFLIEFANFVLSALALFHLDLKMVASLTKIALDAASNSYEPGNDRRPGREKQKVR